MKTYMLVTEDKYELPIAVAESIEELAEITGVSTTSIRGAIWRAKKLGSKSKWIEVEHD